MALTLLLTALTVPTSAGSAAEATAATSTPGGTVLGWGGAGNDVPADLTGVTAISTGEYHSLALKSDGTVVAWGYAYDGQGQTTVPKGLSDVQAVSAGTSSSLALKKDGTVVYWGTDFEPARMPVGLAEVTAISAGYFHGLALKKDGTVVGWGHSHSEEPHIVPAGLTDVIAISAGGEHSLALKSNGTVVGWGADFFDQTIAPTTLTQVTAIEAGAAHSVALKKDGTVVAWGDNDNGQTDVPVGLTNVIAIAAGTYHSLALKSDGTVVKWGNIDGYGLSVPDGLKNVTAISAGGMRNLALLGNPVLTADAPPAAARISDAYSYTFTATGIPAPTFRVSAGALPAGVSLLASGVLSGTPTATGTFEFTVTASNAWGSAVGRSHTLTVPAAWTLRGFTSPVDMAGVWNTVKGGSTVPLKFEVFTGETELTSTTVVRTLTQRQVACPSASAAVDAIEQTVTGGTSLRYDTTAGQFVQNWQTPKQPGTCWTATMTTHDGPALSANFLLQ